MLRRWMLGAALLCCAVGLRAQELKVLTIGNSFADSVFEFLPKIVQSVPDCQLVLERANIGGCTLERHWREVEKSEKDPNYKPYYGKYNLREKLTSKKWDIVTLQQASHQSFRPGSYQPWFKKLYDYVRKYAPQAEIVIQMTWSYRPDHPGYGKWCCKDYKEMYEKLFANYVKTAKEFNCRIIPSGFAVQMARAEQPVKFKPSYTAEDVKMAVYPNRLTEPQGAFIGSNYWRKDKQGNQKLVVDYIHLNVRGRYLQSCVWFAELFGRKTSEIKFVPKGMSAEEAQFLQNIAQKAVNDFQQVNTKK